jgi:hypothetical protein
VSKNGARKRKTMSSPEDEITSKTPVKMKSIPNVMLTELDLIFLN